MMLMCSETGGSKPFQCSTVQKNCRTGCWPSSGIYDRSLRRTDFFSSCVRKHENDQAMICTLSLPHGWEAGSQGIGLPKAENASNSWRMEYQTVTLPKRQKRRSSQRIALTPRANSQPVSPVPLYIYIIIYRYIYIGCIANSCFTLGCFKSQGRLWSFRLTST